MEENLESENGLENNSDEETKIKLLPVKSDFVFKLIFGDQRNVDILAAFLKTVLKIPDDEFDHITIIDPHIKKESLNDKYGILDVKIHLKGGRVVQVEIQDEKIPDMEQRTVYGQSKMVTEQISSGNNWSVIKPVVTILITNYTIVEGSPKYHNQFRNRTLDGVEFTDLTEINTLELNKLPSETDKTDLWHWLKFIKSESEEVLDMLAERSPQMRKAVGVLKELSADERTRMLFEEREKVRRDIASMVNGAEHNKAVVIARNGINMGFDTDTIIKLTGLTFEEIEQLKKTD